MSKNFERELINYFLASGKYKIYELERDYNGKTIWMIQGSFEQVDELVVFADSNNFSYSKDKLRQYINESYVGNKGIAISFVILSSEQDELISRDNSAIISDFIVTNSIIQIEKESLEILQYQGASYSLNGVSKFLQNIRNKKSVKGNKLTLTNVLIGINIIIYIIMVIEASSRTGAGIWQEALDIDNSILQDFGAKSSYLINMGQYYRLFTSMFLHAGLLHVALNMYALKLLGSLIEGIYGSFKFAAIYFTSGVMGAIASYAISPSLSVGASGAIFGLLGAAAIFGIKMKKRIGREFLQSIFQAIIINLVIGFSISNIDNAAHIGGLVGGLITAFAIGNESK